MDNNGVILAHKHAMNERSGAPALIPIGLPDGRKTASSVSHSGIRWLSSVAEPLLDFVTSLLSVWCGYYIYLSLPLRQHQQSPGSGLLAASVIVGTSVVFLFAREGAYHGTSSLMRIRETERVLRIPCLSFLILSPIIFVSGHVYSRGTVLCSVLVLPVFLLCQKSLLASVINKMHAHGYAVSRTVIYGAGYTGRCIFTSLVHSTRLGLKPVAIFDDDESLNGAIIHALGYKHLHGLMVQSGELSGEALRGLGCDVLIVAMSRPTPETILRASLAAESVGARLALATHEVIAGGISSETVDLDGLILRFANFPKDSWRFEVLKRFVDLFLSTLAICALSPLGLLLALLIRFDSPGPVFFRQVRVGKGGKTFKIFKFRSMHVNAPTYAKSPDSSEDPRITKVGRILRRTSLDELPQLINVLLGNMSLVGPRPEMEYLVKQYTDFQRQRLQVLPGITGLWQLSADRAFHIHENPEYDLYYIRNRGFFLDMAILIHTFFFAMRGI
jgi:exopolysaccharide biosynthesis polyprenyl glycosylphosphotransferase